MRSYLTLLKRELRALVKEKTIMLAITVEFFIASLAPVIMGGVMTYYDPDSTGWGAVRIRVGVVGGAATPVPEYLADRKIAVRQFSDLPAAETAFRAGRVNAILYIPENTPGPVDMKLMLPESEVESTVITFLLDEPLKRYEDYLRKEKVVAVDYNDFNFNPLSTYEFINNALIPILMLFPALVAGSMVIDAITEEFERKTFYTLVSTPVSAAQVFAAKVTAAVAAAIIQVIICAGLLIWNGIAINNLGLVLILTVSYIASISFGGAVIALLFRDRQRAQFAYSMIIIGAGAVACFLKPSPLELLTRLAAGAPNTGITGFVIYTVLAVALGLAFLYFSERSLKTDG